MSRAIDSEVYAFRKSFPFGRLDMAQFLAQMALNRHRDSNFDDHVQLECHYRHSVASRLWWILTWTDVDGNRYRVNSQDYELLGMRALYRHTLTKRKLELENQPSHPWHGDLDLVEGAGI